jgi:hypothetical protein
MQENEKPEEKTAEQEAKDNFSRACMEAGRIYYEIDTLKGSLGEAMVRARNANLAYHKLKTAETKQHITEATNPEGVTQ